MSKGMFVPSYKQAMKVAPSIKAKYERNSRNRQRKYKPKGVISLFPPVLRVPMVMYFNKEIASPASQNYLTAQGSLLSINLGSIVTPIVGGSQKMQGYNELSGIYSKYKVHATSVKFTISNASQDGLVVAWRLRPSFEADALGGEYISDALSKKWCYNAKINDTGSQVVKRNFYTKIHHAESITKQQFTADITNYRASIASDPSYDPGLEIALCNTADATSATVTLTGMITMYVEFSEREILATS